jgi:hypothetical protein
MATRFGPLIVLLVRPRVDQSDDRVAAREDTIDVSPASDLFVQPFPLSGPRGRASEGGVLALVIV